MGSEGKSNRDEPTREVRGKFGVPTDWEISMRNQMNSSLMWICAWTFSATGCGDKDSEETGMSDVGGESGSDGDGSTEGDEGSGDGSDDGGDGGDGVDGGGNGSDDPYASQACELLNGELSGLIAAGSESEASQALIVPSETEAWRVESSTDSGYVMLEVEDWMVTVRLFASDGVSLEIMDVGQTASQSALDGCEGYTDQAFEIHEWGSYVIYFEGSTEFALAAIQESPKD